MTTAVPIASCSSTTDAYSPLTVGLLDVVHALPGDGVPEADKILLGLLNRCLDGLPGVGGASLIERSSSTRRPVTATATAQFIYEVEQAQHESGQGPALEAAAGSAVVRCDDLASEERWPGFRQRLSEDVPIRSVLALPVPSADGGRSLNFYSEQPNLFTGALIASMHVAVASTAITLAALRERQRADHLQLALESNRRIGTAVGILMAGHKCTADEAFGLLRVASQHSHRKLRDVADDVVFTGAMPEVPRPRLRFE